MENWQYIFFAASIVLMLGRIVYDNMVIATNYGKMAEKVSESITLTVRAIAGFKGIFKWASRAHYFMVYVALSYGLYWLIHPSLMWGVVVVVTLTVMMTVYWPLRMFTDLVAENFFVIDTKQLEALLDAKPSTEKRDAG